MNSIIFLLNEVTSIRNELASLGDTYDSNLGKAESELNDAAYSLQILINIIEDLI